LLLETIKAALGAQRPLLLDGGMGSELAARGYDVATPLWSAEMILQQPGALAGVHRAYLEAGAECVTTASYQASVPGFAARGLSAERIAAVFDASVEIARAECVAHARRRGTPPALVAASIGPYGAYLADGSEYRGNYAASDAELEDFHASRLELLDAAGADLLACETIPDLREARIVARLLESAKTPAWVSFCCRDAATLHDGNALETAVAALAAHPRVFALGVNCCDPGIVEAAIGRIRAAAPDKLIVVYPNSGQQYDARARQWRGSAELRHWSSLAQRWYEAGAAMIGGCCNLGPRHIRELATRESWHC